MDVRGVGQTNLGERAMNCGKRTLFAKYEVFKNEQQKN
jgi:hypothetical protein